VTKAAAAGCPERALTASADDPWRTRACGCARRFFTIEDARLRASLIGLLENIAARDSAVRKSDGR